MYGSYCNWQKKNTIGLRNKSDALELEKRGKRCHFCTMYPVQWRIQDFPLGGGRQPVGGGGGANLQCVHFSAKMYAKMKEIDPVGGARAAAPPLDPPMLSNIFFTLDVP